jgi:hypothetical protein
MTQVPVFGYALLLPDERLKRGVVDHAADEVEQERVAGCGGRKNVRAGNGPGLCDGDPTGAGHDAANLHGPLDRDL